MKRPALQFYINDWQGNTKLKRCTHDEKGMWVDIICLLHDSEEYGLLRWPLEEIARAIGRRPKDLKGLIEKGILKGADTGKVCKAYIFHPVHARKKGDPITLVEECQGPCWYSSRMIKDEYKREKMPENSRFNSDNQPKKQESNKNNRIASPTHGDGDGAGDGVGVGGGDGAGDGPSTSSSTSITELDKSNSSTGDPVPDKNEGADFRKAFFREGLKLLGGDPHKNRPLMGRWLKEYGEVPLTEALLRAQKVAAVDARAFIEKMLRNGAKEARKHANPDKPDQNQNQKIKGFNVN